MELLVVRIHLFNPFALQFDLSELLRLAENARWTIVSCRSFSPFLRLKHKTRVPLDREVAVVSSFAQ
jgi:hypothetical protein